MFLFLALLMIITKSSSITDLMEGTSPQNVEWQNQDSTPFTKKFSCDNQQSIGPFIGKIDTNIKKVFNNLQPHYSLQVTLDLLFIEYWSGTSNYINIIIDSQTIYSDSSISTSNFNTPNNYCKTNAFLIFLYNQQLITLRQNIIHDNLNPTLEIKSSFQCTLLSLYSVCERLLIKNVVVTPQLCHFTCLTCNGPLEVNCLTCPNGMIQDGKCTCQNGYSSYNYECVQTCPQYYTSQNQKCQLNCSLNCQSCVQSKCNVCENGFILYQGTCVTTCPKSSSLQNNICVDFSEQSTWGSEYIGKYFDGFDIDLLSQINQFTFTFNSMLSKQTGQIFSTYNNQYLLGGFGVWSHGYYTTFFNGLPAHNKLRIYLNAWFIDNWTNEQFIIKLDNQIIYQVSYQSSKATTNLFYLNSNDYIEEIILLIEHTSSAAEITFQTTLSISAYEASLALSNIYILIDFCDYHCDICSSNQCTTCINPYQLIHNKCALCDSTNFRNNDCSCYIGYYDDNLNQQCQKCKQECEQCLNAYSCTQCKQGTNLIILPNCMNCNTGFYYDNGICSKCNLNCLTCFGNEKSQCLSCLNNQILNNNNECQYCQANQFINNNICQDCQYNCETCNDAQICLTCTQGRINAPSCICEAGYFESNNKSCQPCNIQCSTCDSFRDNCLTCSGNRQNPPLCQCQDNFDQNTNFIWCTDCSVANLDIKMSPNIKKLIISFEKKIRKINPDCLSIFEEQTLKYLGIQPICFIQQFSIDVILGENAKVYFGLQIIFQINIIQFQECQNSVAQFFNNILLKSTDLEAPQIIFTKNQVLLSACSNNPDSIYQIQSYNFGSSPITFIDWKLIRVTQQDSKITEIIENLKNQFKNQQQNIIFEFSNDILEMQNEILLELKYLNFLGIQGSSFITIKQLTAKLFLNVQLQTSQYFTSQLIQFYIQVSHCSQTFTNELKLNISTKIGTLYKQFEIAFGEYYIYQIEPYLLNADLYQLNIGVNLKENLIIQDSFQILIVNEEPSIQLFTQSNFLSFSQILLIHGQVKNIANPYPALEWDCFDITQNSECKTLNQTKLEFPNSQNLTIQPYTLTPFSVYMFSAIYQDLYQFATITIVETDVPKIEFEAYPDVSNGYINFYDQLLFKFKYLEIIQNPDLLMYTGILSNSNLLIKHFRFNYLELQISLWHYFTVEQLTKHMTLKINIYNPDYFSPSQLTIPLKINIPPLQCQINLFRVNESTITNFSIKITNCQDENLPLQYRLVLYLNSSDLKFDYSINTIQKGIILIDYQYNNLFQTQLTGNGEIQLMIQVKDNLNGICNYTNSLNFTYEQGTLRQLLINSSSISETLIYATSLQYEDNLNVQEIKEVIQQQINYFSNCQCITQKQLLTLKTLTIKYIERELSDIDSELSLSKERLNKINLQMTNLHVIEYDKFEHTQKEFLKVSLLEETIEIAKYINELYKVNNIYQQKKRVLTSEQDYDGKNTNNYIIMDSINVITEIQLQNQIINGNQQTIMTDSFNISTQKATQKVLENTISSSLTAPQVIGQNEQQNNLNSSLETYSYKMITYKSNPYKYDTYFMNNYNQQNDYPLYQPEIKQLSNQVLVYNLSQSQGIRYNFENQKENLIVECVSKVQDNWGLDACKTVKEDQKVICQCQYVSSTTILEATQQIFDETIDFFSLQTIDKMLNCQYQSIIFTYIVIIYTILFLWYIFYGYKMDQSKNEDLLFNSTKVAPSEWDMAIEKAGGIINVGEIESEKKIPAMEGTSSLRKETQKKTMFSSNDSQITFEDKQLKRPQFEYYNKMLASKKSVGITTNVCSGRIIEETEAEASSRSKTAISPNVKLALSENRSTYRRQQIIEDQSLYKRYSTQRISLCKAVIEYIELNHKVLSLYYLYDKDCSRVYRTIMLYVSLLGEISILTFFGKIINLNTIIALSILQTLFGVIYRKLLQLFLKSQKLCLNYIGFNLAILSVLFFLFIIFGSVAKYQSVLESSLWGVAYLSSFILDYLLYTNIQILVFFVIIIKFGNSETVKKYLKLFLNEKVYIQTFGNS
ncbi:unnamed protein product [Paramecium sonneborni]|uniref:EGF-like domain-containing protein n=1 Tax=Paramecium sonneborni TaxID=65129 RepID=A0A8S1MCC0_9CILI|nr:unnamed protein product [Paramecium sonneborni]